MKKYVIDASIAVKWYSTFGEDDLTYAALSQVTGIPLITADYQFYTRAKNLPFIEALKDLKL